ncbi:MAG: LacI family DNA-binding transcriptional regulator [Butyricicoccus pullicaecorum]|jgi:DNA-binding LacI/PurR family transcriptional regulator|nr:LacI family DNA-binding transcriptional regulator [Butyricicoccus pullicaecorum]
MNLKQIAQEANLSLSTISLVLNNKPGVKPETRKRVSELLIQNGYSIRLTQPTQDISAAPRTLLFIRYRGSGCLMESKDDFFIQILDGVEAQARLSGFNLQILNADRSNLREELLTASRNAVGVILFATELELDLSPILHCCDAPLVVLDSTLPHENINTISVENIDAMYQAVSYLYSIGHTKIGYLHSVEPTGAIPEREFGYYSAIHELGLENNPAYVHRLYLFADRTYNQMCRILAEKPELPTAFVSDNDVLAVGAMRAFQKCGYRIPEDISIIGFDDSYICTIAIPTLTTIRSPKNAIGCTAVRRIQEILDTGDKNIVKSRLCTTLVARDSTISLK